MPLASPQEITAKAQKAYPRFLKKWVRREADGFFPYRVRIALNLNSRDVTSTIAANEQLLSQSKDKRGWGYTVHRRQTRTRDFGNNPVPQAITIDTLDDLLRLANKVDDFAATQMVVDRVGAVFPKLNDWLASHVQSLCAIAVDIDGLIDVARYFVEHPCPDCYARQIPVAVDTKFVSRHEAVLRQWLDVLLPPPSIDVNESKFSYRFGLRDGRTHRAIRLLDSGLRNELRLPFDEFSLPLSSISELQVENVTVFIVENDLNLLTLPSFPRGIAMRGEGNAVNRLDRVRWLANNRVYYWGDIDVDGFVILSRLRNLFAHAQSIMMDRQTLARHERFVGKSNGSNPSMPSNLTPAERDAFDYCARHDRRLEQERIMQSFVDSRLAALME